MRQDRPRTLESISDSPHICSRESVGFVILDSMTQREPHPFPDPESLSLPLLDDVLLRHLGWGGAPGAAPFELHPRWRC